MAKLALVYVLGLVTIVPFCIWMLIQNGTRENAALLIIVPVTWVFFYWAFVMPVFGAWRMTRLMRLLRDPESRLEALRGIADGAGERELVPLLSRESGLPRFVIRRVYARIEPRLKEWLDQQDSEATARTAEAAATKRKTRESAPLA